jgi:hypothetical protein
MTEPGDTSTGLERGDAEVGRQLSDQRPVPSAGFRGALGRHLAARDPGYGPRPAHLRLFVLAYVASGLVLIAVGLLQATGHL